MACDLCSKQGPTKRVRIEGVEYSACLSCAQFGVVLDTPKKKKKFVKREDSRVVKSNFASLLRSSRKQEKVEDFARRLGVKVSEVHAWETGHRVPTVQVAETLGKRLGVSFLEVGSSDVDVSLPRTESASFTIGDLLKKK